MVRLSNLLVFILQETVEQVREHKPDEGMAIGRRMENPAIIAAAIYE